MRSSLISVVALTAAIGLPLTAAAQPDEQAATTATSTTTRSSKGGGETPDQPATTAVRPTPAPLKVNVQIELTITDQTGGAPVEKKTVSMIAADRTWGKVRASAVAGNERGLPPLSVGLNVDARPFVQPDGVVQVEFTIGYNPLGPAAATATPGQRPTELNQSLTVLLQSGKPLIVSQAADPISDRKIVVEVKATVLK
ncbi:MAG: hypothetical protein Q7R30_05055 [Acidobacteriota bacterium]|nr:hypothetical protein [Acidobacteriota bacterium]